MDKNTTLEEMLAVIDENGIITKEKIPRSAAHEKGILHGASHIFIFRFCGDRLQILLQRRSKNKDSFPGCFDISSAGHLSAGMDFVSTALKELKEELGLCIEKDELEFAFVQRVYHTSFFYGRSFNNNELDHVYLLKKDLDISALRLQKSEVEEVVWKDCEEIFKALLEEDPEYCLDKEEYTKIIKIIKEKECMMKTIETKKAPAAIGPYSQAKCVNGFVFTSGQIPIVPESGKIEADTIEGQTKQACENIAAVLEASGSSFDKVVKTTCFLKNMGDFAVFNEIYAKYFTSKPSRSCVEAAALPKGALVEIEVIAIV